MSIREQIAQLVFYPDVRVSGGLLVNAHDVIDLAEARERELLAERQELFDALEAICSMQAVNYGSGINTHMALIGLASVGREAIAKARGEK